MNVIYNMVGGAVAMVMRLVNKRNMLMILFQSKKLGKESKP